MQARAHRADRAADCLRRIGVAHILQIAKDDDFAVPRRQRENRAAEIAQIALARQFIDGVVDGAVAQACPGPGPGPRSPSSIETNSRSRNNRRRT